MKCTCCSKPVSEQYKPFCSKRCADVDLHRWMAGVYAIPTQEYGDVPTDGDDDGYGY